MKIGVFGGTFDPPHIGHNILAAEALIQLGLDRILWVLTANPPHKINQPVTSIVHRLEMVKAAINGEPAFELSRIDIDRPGPHYAVDTVRLLHMSLGESTLFYLIGGDSFRNLHTWERPMEFIEICDAIVVMRRPKEDFSIDDIEKKYPGISKKLHIIETPLIDISSHTIRQNISSGGHFRYYLLPNVYDIIIEHALYKNKLSN